MAEIVSPSVVVDLKWRDEPLSPTQILERIHMVLVSIDDRNETSVQLASSRSPKVVKHGHMEGSETDSYLRVRSTVTRRGSTEKMIQWLAYFALVGMELMKIQDSQRPQKFRHFEYLAATRRQLSKAMIRQMIFNWAVTLELHPCSLGILTETTGVVVVPLGLRIDCQICENPLIRSNEPLTLRAGRRPIPERVVKLEMNNGKKNQPRTKIRAVIVTEHRNTNTDLGGYTEQSKDVIIILTAGYPCIATREFLRLLQDHQDLAHAPFIYVGDHDPHGFQVFTTLKHGSAAMAWIGPSTCIPRLEYYGPTVNQVNEMIENLRKNKEGEFGDRNPSWSSGQTKAAAAKSIEPMRKQFKQAWSKKFNKHDLPILKNVEKLSREDKWLGIEVNRMIKERTGKFSMIELNNIYPGGTALFLIQAADAYSSHDQQLTQRLHSKAKGKAKQHQQSQQLPVRSESVALPRQLEGPKLSSPTQGMHEVTTQNETDPTWTIRDLAVLEDLASQELVL